MTPIPEDARPADPKWAVAYLELANGLVMAGAKARLITRFTDMSLNRVRELYRALRGVDPPSGPLMQGKAGFFTRPGKHNSEAWNIQSAIFLACYDRMGKITGQPLHRGWQLLASFTVYLSFTERQYAEMRIKRLDINQAYALLSHARFLSPSAGGDMRRKECPSCRLSYPVAPADPLDTQKCPLCAINSNLNHLTRQGMARAASIASQKSSN